MGKEERGEAVSQTSQGELQRHTQRDRGQAPPVTSHPFSRDRACAVTSDLYTLRRRRGTVSIVFPNGA